MQMIITETNYLIIVAFKKSYIHFKSEKVK